MHKFRIFFFLIIIIYSIRLSGQLQETAVPFSVSEFLPEIYTFFELAPINYDSLVSDKERFAVKISTNLNTNNSGEWLKTAKGKVWRIGIRSKHAYSLYLTLKPFKLNNNVRLFAYSPGFSSLKGAFTYKNNNLSGVISIAPLPGDEIIIELNVPNESKNFGEINISEVYHDYKNLYGSVLKGTADNLCLEDINCEQGRYWQTEKKAVCKIISEGVSCTGTFIGNTSGSNVPYIITAYHALSTVKSAEEAIVLFNYESEACGSMQINETQTLSGASLIATTDHKLDFTLIKLNQVPPLSYKPFYAGWDATSDYPKSGVCIHHGRGLQKQIAIEYHHLFTAFLGFNFDSMSTWKVPHWEIGSSEPGSSGAPVFNEKHRLTGTLSGGYSSCNYPFGDYFTKINLDWDKYPEPRNQLKYWLDPENNGHTYIDGYDPYGNMQSNCDTAWNITPYDKFSISKSTDFKEFAEKFISPSSIKVSGCFLYLSKVYSQNPFAYIILKLWKNNNLPSEELYSKIVFLKDINPNGFNYFIFDSVLNTQGDFFIGYSVDGLTASDTLNIYHATDRGKGSVSTMFVKKNKWQNTNSLEFNKLATSLGVGVIECYGKIHVPKAESVRLYPNPCNNYVCIEAPEKENLVNAECFSLSGKKLNSKFNLSENINKLFFDLPNGVYIIKITTTSQQFSRRIIVIK